MSSIISFVKMIYYYALLDLLFVVNSRCRRCVATYYDVCHVDVPRSFDQAQRSKIQGSRYLFTTSFSLCLIEGLPTPVQIRVFQEARPLP